MVIFYECQPGAPDLGFRMSRAPIPSIDRQLVSAEPTYHVNPAQRASAAPHLPLTASYLVTTPDQVPLTMTKGMFCNWLHRFVCWSFLEPKWLRGTYAELITYSPKCSPPFRHSCSILSTYYGSSRPPLSRDKPERLLNSDTQCFLVFRSTLRRQHKPHVRAT